MVIPGRRRGFALIAVLWVIAVLGVVAVELRVSARSGRDSAANLRAVTRARWGARAGLARAMESLDRHVGGNLAGIDLAARGDSVLAPLSLQLEGTTVHVAVLDARGRVHLNRANDVELQQLFEATGFGFAAADSLADAILDWRDGDELRRPRGAERADYAAARSAARPTGAPFGAVEELGQLRGMTPARLARTLPLLTVAGDGRINVNSAPVPVLRTLPGIGPTEARAIARRRARSPIRNVFELLDAVPGESRARLQDGLAGIVARASFAPRVVEVVSSAAAGGSPLATSRAVVLLGGATNVELQSVTER